MVICPHTACGMEALASRREAGNKRPHLVAATAHPANFEQVVEPLLGIRIEPPAALASLLGRSSRAELITADYEDLAQRLRNL